MLEIFIIIHIFRIEKSQEFQKNCVSDLKMSSLHVLWHHYYAIADFALFLKITINLDMILLNIWGFVYPDVYNIQKCLIIYEFYRQVT